MNIWQEKSLAVLELPAVLRELAEQAVSQRAKELALGLRPSGSLYQCELLQKQTEDSVSLMGLYGSPSFGGLRDLTDTLKRAEMGGVLNPSELMAVAALLSCARNTARYMENRVGEKTSLDELFHLLSGNKYLEDKINGTILSEEEIADSASPALSDIRRQMRIAASRVRESLNKMISSPTYSKMLQDSIITMRGERYVVPVKNEYRGSVKGLVHDVSASGATVFIEPAAVVEQNNKLRLLSAQEKNEIDRILAELSSEVAQFSASIARDFEVLYALDFIFARGKLACKMKAIRPALSERGETRLVRAFHPLLEREKAVPIDFSLGGKRDTVIVTGPNTGGKTVSIKTLGLLILMAQCGLHIPAGPGSTVRIYEQVLADIGDEQSIQQSLSTFSSHMTNIVEIFVHANQNTLVLLDELGAGTDPVEGAALAVSIIEALRAMGANVAATTHYAELKIFAFQTPGVENASCEFDVQSLMPTYRLVFGLPGKSNAFAIARRLGLPNDIIDRAQSSVGEENRQLEDVLGMLEEKRQTMEKRVKSAENAKEQAEAAARSAEEQLGQVEKERERQLKDAKEQAREILQNARRISDLTIEEAKRLKQASQEGKDENLSAARAALRKGLENEEKKVAGQKMIRKASPLPRPLKVGDVVELIHTGTRAVVLEEPEKDGLVHLQAGILKISAKQSDLSLAAYPPPAVPAYPSGDKPLAHGDASVSLDLRGQNADEAILALERYLDGAYRMRLPSVTVIHGKGTGVLRKSVQAALKTMPQVKSFRLGVYGEGEDGVTIVELKK